jgi:hypothetical protein
MEAGDFTRRGFQVVRLVRVEPETVKPLDEEVRKSIVEVLVRRKVEELAREELKAIATATLETDRTFADLLAEKGLPRVELDPFSARTPLPTIPPAPPEDAPADEIERRKAILREFVVRQRARSAFSGSNVFSEPIVEAGVEAALLIHLIEKLDPDPIEMTEDERSSYTRMLVFQQIEYLRTVFGYESLRERYDFRPPGEDR